MLYFRHDDWQTLCAPLVEKLRADTFQRLSQVRAASPSLAVRCAGLIGFVLCVQRDAEEILRQRKLGFSFVRLLPKETGVRPIVNLRRKKVGIVVRIFCWALTAACACVGWQRAVSPVDQPDPQGGVPHPAV